MSQRHSIQNYADKDVDEELIHTAIMTAARARLEQINNLAFRCDKKCRDETKDKERRLKLKKQPFMAAGGMNGWLLLNRLVPD